MNGGLTLRGEAGLRVDDFVAGRVDAMNVILTNQVFWLKQKRAQFNILDPNSFGIPFYDVNLFSSENRYCISLLV